MINFGTGKLVAVPTNMADGSIVANPTPVLLGTMQDVSLDLSVETKTLYGSKRYPIAVGQGKGKIELKAKNADLDAGVIGSLFFGKASTAGIKAAVFDSVATIPSGSPYTLTIAPPSTGAFIADLGVVLSATGVQMTRVATAPVAGEYSVVEATGVYTFAAADKDKSVSISYEYSAAAGGRVWSITNEVMGYSPSFSVLLQNKFDGKSLVCKLNRGVSGKLNLPFKSDDYAISDFDAQFFADASGNVGYICMF